MKVLVFGDTHGLADFSHLHELAQQADLIVHVGDLTNASIEIAEAVAGLKQLQERFGVPLVITHGNHETRSLVEHIGEDSSLVYLHQRVWVYQDELVFFGFGGGGFARNEPEVEEFFHQAYDDHHATGSTHIWLFHGPPHDLAVDEHPFMGATGSLSKRELIDTYNPHFVFCGHIHESWGVIHEHKNTVLVNPGPNGVLLDITQK